MKEQKARCSEPMSNYPRSEMKTKKKLNPEKTETKKKQLQIWKTYYKAMGNKSRTQGRHEDQETDAPEQKN